jgi:hypothetical protein
MVRRITVVALRKWLYGVGFMVRRLLVSSPTPKQEQIRQDGFSLKDGGT